MINHHFRCWLIIYFYSLKILNGKRVNDNSLAKIKTEQTIIHMIPDDIKTYAILTECSPKIT